MKDALKVTAFFYFYQEILSVNEARMLANHITGLKKMIFLKKSVGPGMPPITLGLKIRMSPN